MNDDPTLDALSDVNINEDDDEQTIDLTGIAAGGGETQVLEITATSNDTGLIPDPTVAYTSANPAGTLSFTPFANQNGIATITVTVEDGGLDNDLATPGDNATVVRTFTVNVAPVNDPGAFSGDTSGTVQKTILLSPVRSPLPMRLMVTQLSPLL